MLRKILFGSLAAVVVLAAGFSAYNVLNGKAADVAPVAGASLPAGSGGYQGQSNGTAPGNNGAGQSLYQGNGWQLSQNSGNGSYSGGGNGNRNGRRWQQSNSNGSQGSYATPNPQNGMSELLTFTGTVSNVAAPNFTLTTSDGQTIPAQLGNLNYLTSIGLTLSEGETVTVVGYWDTSASFAVQQITLASTGQTYSLRDNLGRPLWRGGANH